MQIAELKKIVEEAKSELVKAKAAVDVHKKRVAEIKVDLEKIGVDPNKAQEQLKNGIEEVREKIDSAFKRLPVDMLTQAGKVRGETLAAYRAALATVRNGDLPEAISALKVMQSTVDECLSKAVIMRETALSAKKSYEERISEIKETLAEETGFSDVENIEEEIDKREKEGKNLVQAIMSELPIELLKSKGKISRSSEALWDGLVKEFGDPTFNATPQPQPVNTQPNAGNLEEPRF